MADSLILADQFELLGGGVASTIPQCAGAVFRLAPGFDLSAPQPTSNLVASLILDGERPVGRRASNRSPSLPIAIFAPNRTVLAAARELLVRAIDADTFTLRWTRDGSSLPLVLDCFRASATVVAYSITREKSLVSEVTVAFQGLPYGRSDVPTVVEFPSPLSGKTAPPASITIDNYSTVTGTHWSQSLVGPGPNSAFYQSGGSGVGVVASYTRSGIGPVNLSALSALTVWAGFGSTSFFSFWGLRGKSKGPVQFTFTLSDGTHSASVSVSRDVMASNNSASPVFQQIRVPIPTGSGLNLAAVTGYTITVSNRAAGDLTYTELYLDSFLAVPVVTLAAQPTTGSVVSLAGIGGSARSAFSLQATQSATALVLNTKAFSTPGAFNWLAPPGVTSVQRTETYAAGGKGSTDTGGVVRGGGGAAEYAAEPGVPVTPGNTYPVNVPSGGNTNSGTAGNATFTGDGGITVTAHGGTNSPDNSSGSAGGTGYSPREQMTGQNGGFEGGIGTWAASTNCSIAGTSAQHHSGSACLQVTSTAAGDEVAGSAANASILTQGAPCDPAFPVKVNGWGRASTIARSASVGVEFYDVLGNSLGQFFGTDVTNSTSAWTQCNQLTQTPPSGSVWCRSKVKAKATAAGGEVHYFDDISLVTGIEEPGGAGGPGSGSFGGGGGGAGGPGGVGIAGASGASGGGGGGGNGGLAGYGGRGGGLSNPGVAGLLAGGAGGGAGGGNRPGGLGAGGAVALTYYQTAAFKTLIAHRPGFDAPDTLSPFVPVSIYDTPDGTTEYLVPTLVPGSPARFNSTYTVVLVNNSWNNPSAARTLTITVNHYERLAGTVYTQTISRSVTPNSLASVFCVLGELTLPDHAIPDDNTVAYFTIKVTSGNTSDRFQDVLFLDTLGSTVMIESPTAYVGYWIDEPAGAQDIGNVLGSQFDRTDGVSVLAYTTFSGPPLNVDPQGNQSLMLYAAEGAPASELTFWPRWMLDRLT